MLNDSKVDIKRKVPDSIEDGTPEPLVLRKRERFRAKEKAGSACYRMRCVLRSTQQV